MGKKPACDRLFPMSDLSYPIGREVVRIELTEAERREAIAVIASTPARFRAAVQGLTDEQLDTPYRPGGWTVRHEGLNPLP